MSISAEKEGIPPIRERIIVMKIENIRLCI
jgi:hypothetical protein